MDNVIKKQIVDSIPTLAAIGDPFEKPEILNSCTGFNSPMHKLFGIASEEMIDFQNVYFSENGLVNILATARKIKINNKKEMYITLDEFEGLPLLNKDFTKSMIIIRNKYSIFSVYTCSSCMKLPIKNYNEITLVFEYIEEPLSEAFWNIKFFKNILNEYDETIKNSGVLVSYDASNLKESYINEMKLFLDTVNFSYIYFLFDSLEDEDFFFITRFYDNIDYLPRDLRDAYLEIYG